MTWRSPATRSCGRCCRSSTISTEVEAIRLANDSDYGLVAAGPPTIPSLPRCWLRSCAPETCAVNDAPFAAGGPFGENKASDLGRYVGPEGLHRYLQVKSIALPTSWPVQKGSQGTNTMSSGCEQQLINLVMNCAKRRRACGRVAVNHTPQHGHWATCTPPPPRRLAQTLAPQAHLTAGLFPSRVSFLIPCPAPLPDALRRIVR
jgi:hypothetical protein